MKITAEGGEVIIILEYLFLEYCGTVLARR